MRIYKNIYFCTYEYGVYASHADEKGSSDLCATMSREAMISTFKKLGLEKNSSKEKEIVPNCERFPNCTWFR